MLTTGDIMTLSPSKPVPKKVAECVGHVLKIQMHQSDMPNNSVQIPSGGPQVRNNESLVVEAKIFFRYIYSIVIYMLQKTKSYKIVLFRSYYIYLSGY